MEDIQLDKDMEKEVELVPVISYQNNHKVKNFYDNFNIDKAKVKDNNLR